MGKYFVRGTPLAGLERMMMEVPNFAARSSGTAILCRYHPQAADVDCRNCLQYRRRGCRSLTCLYLAERLQAGAVAMEEMVSKLEQAGKYHAMNLNGGTLPLEELKALDGREAVLDLPVSDRQLGRSLLRAGIANLRDVELSIEIDNLPQKVSNRLHLEREGLDDLNEMCRVIQPLSQAQREMLEAVVCATQPEYAGEVRRLAEELDQFEFIPNVRTAEEFGKYMIRESGHFQYDENLEGFYDYRLYGEQRIREEGGLFTAHGYVAYHGTIPLEELMQDDPAEQYQREQGPQMGGIA